MPVTKTLTEPITDFLAILLPGIDVNIAQSGQVIMKLMQFIRTWKLKEKFKKYTFIAMLNTIM